MDEGTFVLSGGGAKTAAHIGAVLAMEERGVAPERFVATSMGAVIAALFACGFRYDEIVDRMTGLDRTDFALPSFRSVLGPFSNSLFSGRRLRRTLADLVPARKFDQLEIPLTVTSVDAASGGLTLFGAGGEAHVPLIAALYASCALPVYYPPARIGGRHYVDGGLRAVLPLEVAATFDPELVVGVMVGPARYDEDYPDDGTTLLGSFNAATRIMMADQAEANITAWRRSPPCEFVFVRPRITSRATFAVEKVVSFVEQGYRAAIRAAEQRDRNRS